MNPRCGQDESPPWTHRDTNPSEDTMRYTLPKTPEARQGLLLAIDTAQIANVDTTAVLNEGELDTWEVRTIDLPALADACMDAIHRGRGGWADGRDDVDKLRSVAAALRAEHRKRTAAKHAPKGLDVTVTVRDARELLRLQLALAVTNLADEATVDRMVEQFQAVTSMTAPLRRGPAPGTQVSAEPAVNFGEDDGVFLVFAGSDLHLSTGEARSLAEQLDRAVVAMEYYADNPEAAQHLVQREARA